MTTGINMVKIVNNLLRRRMTLMYELSDVYKPALNRNKDKLIELIKEKADRASNSEIAGKLRALKGYYTLEMAPPSKNELEKIQADIALAKEFIQSGCYKYLTVKQAWLLFLVCVEVGMWFFLGETIGKMHIIGYKI